METLPYPDIVLAEQNGFSEPILRVYLVQLLLCKELGRIRQLYLPGQNRLPSRETIEKFEDSLDCLLTQESPQSGRLSASLREKHWRAKIILYRPFLQKTIEFPFEKDSVSSLSVDILDFAERGVQALTKSIRLFRVTPLTIPSLSTLAHA